MHKGKFIEWLDPDKNLTCTAENILKSFHKCKFVSTHCEIKSLTLYYCTLNENPTLFIILMLLVILMCFYLLDSTAEKFLAPALEKLKKKFNISETIAGVTLLALANGSPDIISSITAGGYDSGINLAVGALFGSGFFVTTVVFG